MTPERAAFCFRELMQTPLAELGLYPRRAGLTSQPASLGLEKAQELLVAIAAALASDRGPAWDRLESAWAGMRSAHGALAGDVAPPASPHRPPEWVRDLPPPPRLDDPAPGTPAFDAQQSARARFVPRAPPLPSAPVGGTASKSPPAPPVVAAAPHGVPMSPAPLASSPAFAPAAPPVYGESYAPGSPPPGPVMPGPALAAQGYPIAAPRADHGYAAAPPFGGPFGGQLPSASVGPAIGQFAGSPTAPLGGPAIGQFAPGPHRAIPPPAIRGTANAMPQARESDTSPNLGAWTLSRYAAFCAACAAFPERVADTQHQYGIDGAAARRALDDHFGARFDADADELEQWERLVAQFRGQLVLR